MTYETKMSKMMDQEEKDLLWAALGPEIAQRVWENDHGVDNDKAAELPFEVDKPEPAEPEPPSNVNKPRRGRKPRARVADAPVSRLEWIEAVAWNVQNHKGLGSTDLVVAHAFTRGNFDYQSGEQRTDKYVTMPQLATAAGVHKATAMRAITKLRTCGYLAEIRGSGRDLVPGQRRPTMLHRLCVPAWAERK